MSGDIDFILQREEEGLMRKVDKKIAESEMSTDRKLVELKKQIDKKLKELEKQIDEKLRHQDFGSFKQD